MLILLALSRHFAGRESWQQLPLPFGAAAHAGALLFRMRQQPCVPPPYRLCCIHLAFCPINGLLQFWSAGFLAGHFASSRYLLQAKAAGAPATKRHRRCLLIGLRLLIQTIVVLPAQHLEGAFIPSEQRLLDWRMLDQIQSAAMRAHCCCGRSPDDMTRLWATLPGRWV